MYHKSWKNNTGTKGKGQEWIFIQKSIKTHTKNYARKLWKTTYNKQAQGTDKEDSVTQAETNSTDKETYTVAEEETAEQPRSQRKVSEKTTHIASCTTTAKAGNRNNINLDSKTLSTTQVV